MSEFGGRDPGRCWTDFRDNSPNSFSYPFEPHAVLTVAQGRWFSASVSLKLRKISAAGVLELFL
jgi:hypothetical protein